MIIAKAPLRISVGGGGTDLPSYYEKNNGTTFSSMAINRHVYVSINERFIKKILIRYLEKEEVSSISKIKHPIIKSTLNKLAPKISSIELTTSSDVPGGTGLGSSGSFGVALQLALRSYLNLSINEYILAEDSTYIEKDILKRPIGLQDQFIASFGGLTEFIVEKNGKVKASKNVNSSKTLDLISNNLFLYFSDFSRDAATILRSQKAEMSKSSNSEEFEDIIEMGKYMYSSLVDANIDDYGNCMHDYWIKKRERQKQFTLGSINQVYDHLYQKKLIIGGKLVGAGGSGFLLLVTDKAQRLKKEMKKLGLQNLEFDLEEKGASLIELNI